MTGSFAHILYRLRMTLGALLQTLPNATVTVLGGKGRVRTRCPQDLV